MHRDKFRVSISKPKDLKSDTPEIVKKLLAEGNRLYVKYGYTIIKDSKGNVLYDEEKSKV